MSQEPPDPDSTQEPPDGAETDTTAEQIARDVAQGVGDAAHLAAGAVGHAVGAVGYAAGAVERILRAPIRLPGLSRAIHPHHRRPAPGAAPEIGAMHDVATPPAPDVIHFAQLCYGAKAVERTPINDVAELIASEMPPGCTVRWINVDGLHRTWWTRCGGISASTHWRRRTSCTCRSGRRWRAMMSISSW